MIGRAGRPGFDTHALAVVMVKADKKDFYKRVSNTKLHF
jgi:replicative superfamily II helicase